MKLPIPISLLTAATVFLVGCATPTQPSQVTQPIQAEPMPPATPANASSVVVPQEPSKPAAPVEQSDNEKSLAVALSTFERGEYSSAMKLLAPLTTDSSLAAADRLQALKTLAFSQCLIGAVVACRGTFDRAFKLDPKFDLAPTEQGHPVWGPQFERARKNQKN